MNKLHIFGFTIIRIISNEEVGTGAQGRFESLVLLLTKQEPASSVVVD